MIMEHEFIDLIPLPVLICDLEKIHDRNKASHKFLNKKLTEVSACMQIFEDEDYHRIIGALNQTMSIRKSNVVEHVKLHAENYYYDIDVYFDSVMRNLNEYVMIIFKDSNENLDSQQRRIDESEEIILLREESRRTRQQLINQEKLAGIGHLATGVAHEIFNPLGYVKSNVDTLHQYFSDLIAVVGNYESILMKLEVPEVKEEIEKLHAKHDVDFILEDVGELFEDVDEGMHRVLNIVNGLKRFARKSDDIIEFNMNEGLKSTLMIAKNEFKYCAELEVDYKDVPNIQAHSSKVNQVLLGFIINAVYAIQEQNREGMGLLKIRTFVENNYVCCEVCDDGIGIKPEKLENIFDPFYTTKPEGIGTGLGLSIAWDIIVEQHRGQLDVKSEVGVGTCFTIRLPMSDDDTVEENDELR